MGVISSFFQTRIKILVEELWIYQNALDKNSKDECVAIIKSREVKSMDQPFRVPEFGNM